jgi:outer membrane lipopolysaccharide assembly protein LptE/RlpB
MIEEKKVYPITIIKGLSTTTRNKLTSNGIILLKQLTEKNIVELRRQTGTSKQKLASLVDSARAIISGY